MTIWSNVQDQILHTMLRILERFMNMMSDAFMVNIESRYVLYVIFIYIRIWNMLEHEFVLVLEKINNQKTVPSNNFVLVGKLWNHSY